MHQHAKHASYQEIELFIRSKLAEALNTTPDMIDVKKPFTEMGLNSISAISLSGELADKYRHEMSPTIFWENTTIELLTSYIHELLNDDITVAEKNDNLILISAQKKNMHINDSGKKPHNLIPEISLFQDLKSHVNQLSRKPLYFVISEHLQKESEKNGKLFVNYSIYDYLGLANDSDVKQASIEAIHSYGSSVSASRLAGGEKQFHLDLESEISRFLGMDDAIVFTSGHATNVTTIGHVMHSTDLIICDQYSHNSILQGAKLSGATVLQFDHNNLAHLSQLLDIHADHFDRVMIIIEGVYSMDGDIPNLPDIIHLKKKHQALLYIDEAHSIGVIGHSGRGIMEYFQVDPHDVDFAMGTLGKAIGSIGGYIAGKKEMIDYLKHSVPGFVYSLGFGPAQTCSALMALKKLGQHPELPQQLRLKSMQFVSRLRQVGLNCGTTHDTPIVPIIIGDSNKTIEICSTLRDEGIFAQAIIYPAVEDHSSRLRLFINHTHSEDVLIQSANTIIKCLK